MKKTFRVLGMACLMGAFAFLGSSCNKETETTTSIQANLPGVVEEAGTFGQGLRAYIDYTGTDWRMKWSDGDQVMIYNLDNDWTQSKRAVYTLNTGAGTTQAGFMGDDLGEELGIGFRVFYPASKVVNHPLGDRNSQTFDVPATQTYAKDCMDPTSLVMACRPLNGIHHATFNMEHIFGFVNIRIADVRNYNTTGTHYPLRKVASVQIEDCFYNLNGNITADLPGVNPDELQILIDECAEGNSQYMAHLASYLQGVNYTSEPGDKTITLNCPGGVQLSDSGWTNFVFTLRPGSLSKGFDVVVTLTDGTQKRITTFNPSTDDYILGPTIPANGFCTKPGNLMNFNVLLWD